MGGMNSKYITCMYGSITMKALYTKYANFKKEREGIKYRLGEWESKLPMGTT
jgi:hypothetical protein